MSNPIPIPPGRQRRPTPSPTHSNSSNSSQSSRNSQSSNVSGGMFTMDPEIQAQTRIDHNAQRASPEAQFLYQVPVTYSQRFLDHQARTHRRDRRGETAQGSGRSSPVSAPPPYSTHPPSPLHTPMPNGHHTGQTSTSYRPSRTAAQSATTVPPHHSTMQSPPSYPSHRHSCPPSYSTAQRQGQSTSASTSGRRRRDTVAAHVGIPAPPSQQRPQ